MDEEIIEITGDCLVKAEDSKLQFDIESGYRYLNPFFFLIGAVLAFVFYLQIKNGLFDLPDDKIDYSNFTYRFSNSKESGSIIGVFTSMFLHGGFEHLLGNIIYLYIFSLVMHRLVGVFESIMIFILTGIFAGFASYFMNDVPSLGASGAIFGLFGFISVFFMMHRNNVTENMYDLSYVLVVLAIFQIGTGFTVPYVDNFAHIGGYLSGVIIGFAYFQMMGKDGLKCKNVTNR